MNDYEIQKIRDTSFCSGYNTAVSKYENKIADLEAKLKHAEENCINKTCVVFKDKEDCVAKLLELEKENAELKERFKHRNCLDCSNHHINIKLFKAKEIIREFVEWATWQGNSKCPSFKSIQDKAEQFLNSEVEK